MAHYDFNTPVDEAAIRALRVNDTVTLNGTLFGIRDATQIHMFDRGRKTRFDLAGHAVIHTAPNRDSDHEYFHWHIEIMPKLTKVAGFEWGSGFYINPTPPEDAAAYMREVRGPAPEANGGAGSKASSEVPA